MLWGKVMTEIDDGNHREEIAMYSFREIYINADEEKRYKGVW